jgi:hypothetical protein
MLFIVFYDIFIIFLSFYFIFIIKVINKKENISAEVSEN